MRCTWEAHKRGTDMIQYKMMFALTITAIPPVVPAQPVVPAPAVVPVVPAVQPVVPVVPAQPVVQPAVPAAIPPVAPVSQVNQYTLPSKDNEAYIVQHGSTTCQVLKQVVSCTPDLKAAKQLKKEENGEIVNRDNINPYSLDFTNDKICIVTENKGYIKCGDNVDLNSNSFLLHGMTGSDITDVRFNPSYPYMCIRNKHSQVWCMAFGSGTDQDPIFNPSREWTRMNNFKNIDQIEFKDTQICGTNKDGKSQCVEIGTTFDEKTAGDGKAE
eukprot:NODE_466_length_7077_cov_0.565205.p3 type:complete len:271 gc:universal NODE_466_length_7077_cov_0.565205:2801-1989(-)